MIAELIEKGLLHVDLDVLTKPVVVSEIVVDQEVKVLTAEVGTPMPTDLGNPDPAVWTSLHEALGDEVFGNDE
jgi:hypothetical protein